VRRRIETGTEGVEREREREKERKREGDNGTYQFGVCWRVDVPINFIVVVVDLLPLLLLLLLLLLPLPPLVISKWECNGVGQIIMFWNVM
jgi:hypothetical protein